MLTMLMLSKSLLNRPVVSLRDGGRIAIVGDPKDHSTTELLRNEVLRREWQKS